MKLGNYPEMSLKEARQITRQKKKELGQEPPKGYVFADAFRIWCDQKRGRIVSYENEKRMIERHLLRHIKNRQLDEITAPLIDCPCREAASGSRPQSDAETRHHAIP